MSWSTIHFDRSGKLEQPAEVGGLIDSLRRMPGRELLIFAHGWLEDEQSWASLAERFAAMFEGTAVCCLRWPSKPAAGGGGFLQRAIEFASYYTMKERAARIGAEGLAPVIEEVGKALPQVGVHLAGHSFGARLVTSAVAAVRKPRLKTLALLQGAFSQFAFAPTGAFRGVICPRRLKGPVLVTHSCNDIAIGEAYPIASYFGKQVASALGDAQDAYGGLGRNGAQGMKAGECANVRLGDVEGLRDALRYPVINLNADAVIRGHSDFVRPEVGEALRTAMQWGGVSDLDCAA